MSDSTTRALVFRFAIPLNKLLHVTEPLSWLGKGMVEVLT